MPPLRVFLYEFTVGGGLLGCGDMLGCGDTQLRSLSAEGRAMHRALAEDFAALGGVEVSTVVDRRITCDVSGPWKAAVVSSPSDERSEFERCASQADWTVVIAPETGGLLLERCRWVLQCGGRLLGPGPEFVAWTADKSLTAEKLARSSIPVPPGVILEHAQPLPDDFPFPAVLKPNDGAGSIDARCVVGPRDVERGHLAAFPRWRLERHCPGIPASVAVVSGPGGPVLLPPCGQTISQDGRLRYLGGTAPLAAGDLRLRATRLAEQVARAVEPTLGYFGIDLVLGTAENGSQDFVIEINPRLTTSYVGLRQAVRENLAGVQLDTAEGRSAMVTCGPCAYHFDMVGRVSVCRETADRTGRGGPRAVDR